MAASRPTHHAPAGETVTRQQADEARGRCAASCAGTPASPGAWGWAGTRSARGHARLRTGATGRLPVGDGELVMRCVAGLCHQVARDRASPRWVRICEAVGATSLPCPRASRADRPPARLDLRAATAGCADPARAARPSRAMRSDTTCPVVLTHRVPARRRAHLGSSTSGLAPIRSGGPGVLDLGRAADKTLAMGSSLCYNKPVFADADQQ